MKILIIEDDQIVANIYRNKLSVEGYEVEVALDGPVGLELVRSFRPDAIILDLMLPKMTGVEFMKQIRSEPEFEHLPVIVFSNTYLTNLVQEAWKAGATKCLSKSSCTPRHVLEVVRNALPGSPVNKNGAKPAVVPAPAAPASPFIKTVIPRSLPVAAPLVTNDADAQFQADLRKSLLDGLPSTLSSARSLLQASLKSNDPEQRLKHIHDLYRRIHALTGNAGLAGMMQLAHMSDALEALLKEIHEKPKNITASSLRTVASAIDFLAVLSERCVLDGETEPPPANILVVDDEAISRRALTYSLEKARLKSVNVEDPQAALRLLSENRFDLIFLDVDMPGMTGFELCSKLRALPAHKKTPVVFVTSLTDFESRANSTMSGGNDFIAKPFLFIELAVKALVYVLRGRLPAKAATTPAAPAVA